MEKLMSVLGWTNILLGVFMVVWGIFLFPNSVMEYWSSMNFAVGVLCLWAARRL